MRTLTIFCGLTLAIAVGCSKKQPRTDSRQSAYVQLLNFRCRDANVCRRAVGLCRRAAAEVDRPPSTTVDRAGKLENIAERAQELRLPRNEVLSYARRAFDYYFASGRLFFADHVFHRFGIGDETRHRNLVLYTYAGLEHGYTTYSSLATDDDFRNRHGLDPLSAQHAYELAMKHRVFDAAMRVAEQFHLSERAWRNAKQAHLGASFDRSVEYGNLREALLIAEQRESTIAPDRIHTVALQYFTLLLERNGTPFDAHRVAVRYRLGDDYERRALDAAFQRAREEGRYQIARRLPTGEFMIISPP